MRPFLKIGNAHTLKAVVTCTISTSPVSVSLATPEWSEKTGKGRHNNNESLSCMEFRFTMHHRKSILPSLLSPNVLVPFIGPERAPGCCFLVYLSKDVFAVIVQKGYVYKVRYDILLGTRVHTIIVARRPCERVDFHTHHQLKVWVRTVRCGYTFLEVRNTILRE
jgi:hypothetical protein